MDKSKYCANLVKKGECEKNSTYMNEFCPLSCGLCTSGSFQHISESMKKVIKRNFRYVEGLCLNGNKYCDRLAAEGQCKTNGTYMNDLCPISCGKCGEGRLLHYTKYFACLNKVPFAEGFCLDKNKKCREYLEQGDCQSKTKYMTEFCPASCGKCEIGKCLSVIY